MKKSFYITIPFIIIAAIAVSFLLSRFFSPLVFKGGVGGGIPAEAAASRLGLTLDLKFGNNNGASAPTVFDSSGYGRNATSTAGATAPACNNKFCDFDGGGYMTADATNVFNSSNISIAVKFAPDFSTDGTQRVIFDTTVGARYLFYKETTDVLALYLNGAAVSTADMTASVWGPYWMVGKENVLIISGTTGNTSVWLNGNKILSGKSTAWSAGNPTSVTLGAIDLNKGSKFDGKIHYFKVWNRLLTDAEVAALSADRTTYTKSASMASSTGAIGSRLVGYWTMDTNDINGTTVYDKSGQGSVATSTSAPSLVAGKINQAVNINSLPFNIGNQTTYNFTTAVTVSAWVKFQDQDGLGQIIGRWNNGIDNNGFQLSALINEATYFSVYTTSVRAVTGPVLTIGKWYHLAGVYDNSNAVLYVDGVAQTPTSAPGPLASQTNALRIGGDGSGSRDFNGSLDDVRIYNYAMSAQEVANLYSSAKINYTASAPLIGLVGYWTMDRNDATSTPWMYYDRSGMNNHATSTANPTFVAGKINQAVNFNGTSNVISVNNSASLNVAQGTYSFWAKATSLTALHRFFSQNNGWSAGSGSLIVGFSNSSGYKVEVVYPTGSPAVMYSNTPVVVGRWYNVVVTYNGSVYTLYVDGVFDKSVNQSGNLNTGTTRFIGSDQVSGGNAFAGYLDDVRIYNRALSAQEVANLYQSAAINYVR